MGAYNLLQSLAEIRWLTVENYEEFLQTTAVPETVKPHVREMMEKFAQYFEKFTDDYPDYYTKAPRLISSAFAIADHETGSSVVCNSITGMLDAAIRNPDVDASHVEWALEKGSRLDHGSRSLITGAKWSFERNLQAMPPDLLQKCLDDAHAHTNQGYLTSRFPEFIRKNIDDALLTLRRDRALGELAENTDEVLVRSNHVHVMTTPPAKTPVQ